MRIAAFLRARWIDLVMMNFEVDPSVLHGLAPRGTEIDLFDGRCLASVVGFNFRETRVRGFAVPFHRHFEEVNLRFYVRRTVGNEVRRGVVFVKEIVPRRAISWLANLLYHEKYVACPMSHERSERSLSYSWKVGERWCRLGATLEGEPFLPAEDSEEAFITEHYWGYARRRDATTLEYEVEHPRWNVWRAGSPLLECDVEALYGARFALHLSMPPASCFVADGSEIVVRRARSI